jgi:hypothetical protein
MNKFNRVAVDSRSCFGISFFANEEDAERYAKDVQARGKTHNGGFSDGVLCVRNKSFDRTD